MNVRIAVVDGLAIAVIVLVGLDIWRRVHPDDLEVQRIAARLMPCPADQIEVLASEASDTAEVHRVRACGTKATVICSAPDFECVLDPTRP